MEHSIPSPSSADHCGSKPLCTCLLESWVGRYCLWLKPKSPASARKYKQAAAGPASVPACRHQAHNTRPPSASPPSATYDIYRGLLARLRRGIEDHMFSRTIFLLPQDRHSMNCLHSKSCPDPRHPTEDRPHSRSRCPCEPCESVSLAKEYPPRPQHGDWGKCHGLSLPFCLSLQLLN